MALKLSKYSTKLTNYSAQINHLQVLTPKPRYILPQLFPSLVNYFSYININYNILLKIHFKWVIRYFSVRNISNIRVNKSLLLQQKVLNLL